MASTSSGGSVLEVAEEEERESTGMVGGSEEMGGSEESGGSAERESMRLANIVYRLNDATLLGCFV